MDLAPLLARPQALAELHDLGIIDEDGAEIWATTDALVDLGFKPSTVHDHYVAD